MKVKFAVTFDIEDELTEVEFLRSIESKRRYLEQDVRVRFHDSSLKVIVDGPAREVISQKLQAL
jgi:hypothetical protein